MRHSAAASQLENVEELEEREFIAQNSKRFRVETAGGSLNEEEEDGEEEDSHPEDAIPDLPENQAAREFLRKAPRKGLHMPLGKEVKVMQCWRCKAYGHRSGDRECPMRNSGNDLIENQRRSREDPMSSYTAAASLPTVSVSAALKQQQSDDMKIQRRIEKYARVEQLMVMLLRIPWYSC